VRLTGSGRGAENCLALERANSMIAMASINAAGKLMTEYRRIMRHMTQTVGRPVGEAILKKTPYNRKAARLGGERRGLPSALLIGGWGAMSGRQHLRLHHPPRCWIASVDGN
jgi:hypothetical protein